jgi:TolA-binding protein
VEGKKLWVFIGILGLIILSPVIAFNNASMGCYQRRIDKYPESESSRNWQWRMGSIYYNSLRADKAADSYQRFYKNEKWLDEPRRPMAMERHASILEELSMKAEAIEVWKLLAREYPDHNLGKLALAKLNNEYKIFTLDPKGD